VDLPRDEQEVWAALRHKARQYIRKARQYIRKARQYIRKAAMQGIRMERDVSGAFLPEVRRIDTATAARAGVALHRPDYYRRVYDVFGPHTRLSSAIVDGQLEAFLWVV